MALSPGDPAPWFTAPTPSNPTYAFDSVAGRYVLLVFLPTDLERRGTVLSVLAKRQAMFDDVALSAFVVVRDPQTAAGARDMRGLRWFIDLDRQVSRLYGAAATDGGEDPAFWLLLDPTLRVLFGAEILAGDAMLDRLAALPSPEAHAGVTVHAPVLIAPRIFEPELCRALIDLHREDGGRLTGVMRDEGARTVHVMDEQKQRRDLLIEDPELLRALQERLERRLFPMITHSFMFRPTRIERYLVSCYDAADGGIFHAHRDDVTFGTAHRRFACSINLNDDFEGGDLRFPEFGPTLYRPPVGGAAVFACGVLHEATQVTAGRRYAFLPFVFDEAGAETKDAYQTRHHQEAAAQ